MTWSEFLASGPLVTIVLTFLGLFLTLLGFIIKQLMDSAFFKGELRGLIQGNNDKFEGIYKQFEGIYKQFEGINKRIDDLKEDQRSIRENQTKIELQLTNHVTETNKEIQDLKVNQMIIQKDLSEVKNLLKNQTWITGTRNNC